MATVTKYRNGARTSRKELQEGPTRFSYGAEVSNPETATFKIGVADYDDEGAWVSHDINLNRAEAERLQKWLTDVLNRVEV